MIDILVSIIIPTFNRQKFIAETLNSVISQTYFDWEVIVIDDGSKDGTCNIVEGYIQKDKRIRLLHREREPKGASTCRNIGIENASGWYLIFLDSDDLLMPFCLQQRLEYMNRNPELDFAVFQMGLFNDSGLLIDKRVVQKFDNYLFAFLRHQLPWNITSPIWRTNFVVQFLKGYNEKYPRLQDPEFNTRALMFEHLRFKVLDDCNPDANCRIHSDKIFNVVILLTGFKCYIEEFSEKINLHPDAIEGRKQLKYCYIEAVRGFYEYYQKEFNNDSTKLVLDLMKLAFKKKVIAIQTVLLTNLLVLLYRGNIMEIKGGKFIIKAVMKLIKVL